jgi:hypothetical protein
VIPKILFLVEQIRPRTTQIYNLRTSVSILLQTRTFEAVESIGDTFTAADDTLVLIVAEGAFVTDASEGRRTHVGVADGTFAVALVTETTNRYSCLFATHYEIPVRC